MRFLSTTLALFLSILLVEATIIHDTSALAARRHHSSVARSSLLETRQQGKICPKRVNKHAAALRKANQNSNGNASGNNFAPAKNATTPVSKPPAPKPAAANPPAPAPNPPAPQGGLVRSTDPRCGGPRAQYHTSKLNGPNGHMDWLSCGFESPGGWQPPHLTMQDIVTQPLSQALKDPASPFKNCASFIHLFEKYGNQFGIAPIMLASFAMQESYCQPNTVGGGGEQGLMQITHEKCKGAPLGNCLDPEFNIATAARYFATTLAEVGGNVLLAAGRYNGWFQGLTKERAFAAKYSNCCRCQNNGDYLHQLFNAWVLNINAYNMVPRIGKYFNLDDCPK